MHRIFFAIVFILPMGLFAQIDMEDIILMEKKAALKHFIDEDKSYQNEYTENYDLKYHRFEWFIDPSVKYISGKVRSDFMALEQMDSVYFQLNNALTVDSVHFHGASTQFTHNNDMLGILLDPPVMLNSLDSVSIFYQGEPDDGGFGSFIQDEHGPEDAPIISTLSEPYGAKDWWPCKQTLNDKIDSVDILVWTTAGNRAASNGLLVNEIHHGDSSLFHWKHRYPTPAYLIAIAVTNYQYYSDWVHISENDSLEILNYVYPESYDYAQTQTPQSISMMEYFIDRYEAYPYEEEKYGHAQFTWGGGMEHATMSFMGSFAYILQAHELAHQWFGNKITCGSWEDIWLNEGFATYVSAQNYEAQGLTESWEQWKSTTINIATSENDGSVKVDDTTSVDRIFSGRLSYRKGAMLLHMLRWEIGDELFFEAMRNYLADPDLEFSYARTSDVQYHFEAVSGRDFSEFFKDWYEGEGYPSHVITYYQEEDLLELEIHQEQSHSSVSFYELKLPLLLKGETKDSLIVVDLIENDLRIDILPGFKIESIQYDPEKWILSARNRIINGPIGLNYQEGMQVYPNPTQGLLNVVFEIPPPRDQRCLLYNSAGARVLELDISKTQQFTIDMSGMADGNYTLVIENEVSKHSRQVVKRK